MNEQQLYFLEPSVEECLFSLCKGLHAINLGDSGFTVVREGTTVFQSPVQQHGFNFTYQLESGNSADVPSSGQVSFKGVFFLLSKLNKTILNTLFSCGSGYTD